MDQVKKSSFIVLILMLVTCRVQEPTPTMPVPSRSPLPSPSETSLPAPIATNQSTPTTTLIPLETLIAMITPEIYPTETPMPFPKPDGDSSSYWNFEISPEGEWIAWIGCCAQIESYPHMIVENLTGDKSWLVTFPEEFQAGENYCSGGCYINPVFWSPDGKFLYYETHPVWDLIIPSHPILALMRLSLQNGHIDFVLPPQQNDYYYYAFSPDGEWFVYTNFNPPGMNFTIDNLFSGKSSNLTMEVNAEALGIIHWSPFDPLFIVHIFGEDWKNIFYVVNIQDRSYRKIYEGDFPLDHYEWYSPQEILLSPLDYSEESPVFINIQTGEITPVEATD